MTKLIHVVNGDSSIHKVSVVVEQQLPDFTWVPVKEFFLDNPGGLVSQHIWDNQRIVIIERK